MPLDTLWIKAVTSRTYAGFTRYTILGSHEQGGIWDRELFTKNAFTASLCKESQDRFPLVIGSRETKWGCEIVTCDRVVEEQSA